MSGDAGLPTETLDVAIVGGGVAGLYAAWRLRLERPDATVSVFEAAETVGGRLRTFAFDEVPGLPVDLGGMMFSRSHVRVLALCHALGLTLRRPLAGKNNGVVFLRGRALRRRAIRKHGFGRLFPFALSRAEQAKGQLPPLLEAAERLVPGAMAMTRDDWQALYRSGSPLRDIPYRAALADVLGFEMLNYVEGRAGVSLYTRGPSALHMFETLAEHARMERGMLVPAGGFQELPLSLADAVRSHGGMVLTGQSLVGLSAAEEGTQLLRLRDVASGAERCVTARRVVLAMPRRAIESVGHFPARDAPGSSLQALLRSVEPHPMGKLLLAYPSRWWRPLGDETGFSSTDMPLGQVWLFAPETGASGVAAAIFDGDDLDFWRSLMPRAASDAAPIRLEGDSAPVREAHRQMKLMFGPLVRGALPDPIAGCFQDWRGDPFGGAIHMWGRGADAGEAAAAMLKPVEGLDLFVCGEAWSHRQGWVEGALERVDALLHRWFDMPSRPPESGAVSTRA